MAKRLLLLGGFVLVVLALAGLVVGGIGSAVTKQKSFLAQPEIHLPPQPIFPKSRLEESYQVTDKGEHAATPADHDGTPSDSHQETPTDGHAEPAGKEGASEGHAAEPHFQALPSSQWAITNTLLSAWVASIAIILFFVLGVRKRSEVPGRFPGMVESVVEGVLSFATGVLGPEMARKTFPVIATIFLFVLFNAWIALFLVPIYQAVGFGSGDPWNFVIRTHLLRPAGTDLNMPLALALISFVFVEYWGIRVGGFGYFKKFFAFGNLLRLRASGIIDAFVGILEFISELVRIVSFTFRLFGNMTAGEILVVMITFLVPFVANLFVFGLELLVGLVQSVIFAGLTLVFLNLAVSHGEHAEHG
ncbi:MAG: F0F1 ATP synthase subunit A [Dehalococcoidia bacterium]